MIGAPADSVTRAVQNVLLSRNPTRIKLQSLEEDMKDILARTDLHDDAKLSLYQQTLQRYLQYDHALKTEPVSVTMSTPTRDVSVPSGDGAPSDENPAALAEEDDLTPQILESVPKTLRRKAKLLIDRLKHNDVMAWNAKGELVYEGNIVKGSNMIDLVNDALKGKRGFFPHGYQYFLRGLAKSNAPESIIGNEARRSLVRKYKQMGSEEMRLLPDIPPPLTPISSQRRRRVTPLRAKKRLQWETL